MQQVSAFLHRHLILLGPLAAAIDLAVGERIGAEVMRGEREFPALAHRIVHEGHDEGLRHGRSEQQELRRHRIEDIGGADASVRVVLLAEGNRLAVGIGHELAGRETLAVGQRRDPGILHAPRLGEIRHQLGIKLDATLLQRGVVLRRSREQILRLPAVAPPERTQVLLHVLDRKLIVVSEHQRPRDRFGGHLEATELQRRHGGIPRDILRQPGGGFPIAQGEPVLRVAPGCCQIEIAPIDADIIPLLREQRLIHGTDLHRDEIGGWRFHFMERGGDLLRAVVHGDLRGGVEVEVHAVDRSIRGVEIVGDIGDRAREQIDVSGQSRGEEGQGERDARAFELIDRTGGQDLHAFLRQRRRAGGFRAEHPEVFPINAYRAVEPVLLARPVDRIRVRGLVRGRPDAEIRIMRDQRHGRRTQRVRIHLRLQAWNCQCQRR